MVAQPAYSSPPTPNRGSTRWRIAARQISTTRSMVFPLLARGARIYIVAACRPGPEDNRACGTSPENSRGRADERIICPVGYRLQTREMPGPRLRQRQTEQLAARKVRPALQVNLRAV